jgi:choline dehydrogenase-like flavoprotein
MLPYFRRADTHWDPKGDRTEHGFDGPVHTATISSSRPHANYTLRKPLLAAGKKVGAQRIQDGNCGNQLGVTEMVENWRYGKRQLARVAYDFTGVHILTETFVQQTVLEKKDSQQVATGVQLADGTGKIISATKEVILSARVYQTPKILMLFGIGPKSELEKHGIPHLVESPEVGRKFYNHMARCQWWRVRNPEIWSCCWTAIVAESSVFHGQAMRLGCLLPST